MCRLVVIISCLLSACTTFDKTNILPGQRVHGLGFSFAVPGDKSWFTVVYGNSHRIKVSQLNYNDFFSITASMNRGPSSGIYQSAEAHLVALQKHLQSKPVQKGYIPIEQREWTSTAYGNICVSYSSSGEDWKGRSRPGPAILETFGLSCEHPKLNNVLLTIEITRRYEVDANKLDLGAMSKQLFRSLKYHDI